MTIPQVLFIAVLWVFTNFIFYSAGASAYRDCYRQLADITREILKSRNVEVRTCSKEDLEEFMNQEDDE